ncbi:MAG TPA: DUF4160 domain-containing protein [Bacteroidia bacterium]|nr:DUF4160 domain-containing protein [Bacteroidia bacterium]
MADNVLERALTDLLSIYMNYDDTTIERLLIDPNRVEKERVIKLDDLEVLIYSNDHNPPHFHVKAKGKNIDAKFLIETGEFMKGEIDSKNLKRIKAYYMSPKTKIIMQLIWDKRLQNQHANK